MKLQKKVWRIIRLSNYNSQLTILRLDDILKLQQLTNRISNANTITLQSIYKTCHYVSSFILLALRRHVVLTRTVTLLALRWSFTKSVDT